MRSIFFIIAALCFTSCKDNCIGCDQPFPYYPTSTTIFISITDKDGNDLLDQSKENSFKIEDIRALENKENQNLFILGSNNPERLVKLPNENLTSYELSTIAPRPINQARLITKWTSINIDTIDLEFYPEIAIHRLSKVIVNGEEILDTKNLQENNFMYRIHLVK